MSPDLRPPAVVQPAPSVGTNARLGRRPTTSARVTRTLVTDLYTTAVEEPSTGDESDHTAEPDPWEDVPEEIDLGDPDEPALLFDDQDGQERQAVPVQPILSFTVVGDQAPSRQAQIRVRTPPGLALSTWASAFSPEDPDSPLQALGDALARTQREAILARSRLEAFERLRPETAKALADAAGWETASVLSRRRHCLVSCPWGEVPLEFFWWKGTAGPTIEEVQQLVRVLREQPSLADKTASREAVKSIQARPGTRLSDETGKRIDALRRQVPAARALLPYIDLLNGYSLAFPRRTLDELEEYMNERVPGLAKRGQGLLRLALVGALLPLS